MREVRIREYRVLAITCSVVPVATLMTANLTLIFIQDVDMLVRVERMEVDLLVSKIYCISLNKGFMSFRCDELWVQLFKASFVQRAR